MKSILPEQKAKANLDAHERKFSTGGANPSSIPSSLCQSFGIIPYSVPFVRRAPHKVNHTASWLLKAKVRLDRRNLFLSLAFLERSFKIGILASCYFVKRNNPKLARSPMSAEKVLKHPNRTNCRGSRSLRVSR